MALNVTFEAEKRRAELNTSPETSESAAGAENVGVSRLFACFCMFSQRFSTDFSGFSSGSPSAQSTRSGAVRRGLVSSSSWGLRATE